MLYMRRKYFTLSVLSYVHCLWKFSVLHSWSKPISSCNHDPLALRARRPETKLTVYWELLLDWSSPGNRITLLWLFKVTPEYECSLSFDFYILAFYFWKVCFIDTRSLLIARISRPRNEMVACELFLLQPSLSWMLLCVGRSKYLPFVLFSWCCFSILVVNVPASLSCSSPVSFDIVLG